MAEIVEVELEEVEGSGMARDYNRPRRQFQMVGGSMRIFGIDPGTRKMGFGLIEEDRGSMRLLESGCISAPAKMPLPERLAVIGEHLKRQIEESKPDVVAIEKAFHGQNIASLIALGEGRGVALYCAARSNIPIHEYAPTEVKKAVTGSGSATKAQVSQLVKVLLACSEQPEGGEDGSDALAVAICHAHRSSLAPAVVGDSSEVMKRLAVGRGRPRRGRGR